MGNSDLLHQLQKAKNNVNQTLVQEFVSQTLALDFIQTLEVRKIYNKNYYTVSAQNSTNLYTLVILPTYQTMEYAVLKIQNKENKNLSVEFSPHLEDDMIYETYKLKFDDIYTNYFERKNVEENVNNLYNFLEVYLEPICVEKSLILKKTENSLKVYANADVYLEFDFSRPSVISINFEKLSKKLAFQSIMHRSLKKLENYYTFLNSIDEALNNLEIYKETGDILLIDKKTKLNEFLEVFTKYNLYPNVDYLPFKLSSVTNLGSKSKNAIFSNLQHHFRNIKINFELCVESENYVLKTNINGLHYENIFKDVFHALEYIHQIKNELENNNDD